MNPRAGSVRSGFLSFVMIDRFLISTVVKILPAVLSRPGTLLLSSRDILIILEMYVTSMYAHVSANFFMNTRR